MKKLLVLTLLVLFATPALAADGKMSFELPKGWVLDKKVVSNQGIDAAIYPKNQEWKTAPVVIYARLAPKVKNSLQATIEDDVKGFQEINDQLILKDEPSIFTQDNKLAFVKRLTDPKNGSTSITAYVDSGDNVSIIAIDAKSKAAASKAYPIFKGVVNSYLYVTSSPAKTAGTKAEVREQVRPPKQESLKPAGKKAERGEYRDSFAPKAEEKPEPKAEMKSEPNPEQKKPVAKQKEAIEEKVEEIEEETVDTDSGGEE